MRSQITGNTMPVLTMELSGRDCIVAEPGEFSWMSSGVQMRTSTYTAGAKSIWKAIGRAFGGGGLFMTEYSAPAGGQVSFAAKVPGEICEIEVPAGQSYRIHRHGFVCATSGVNLSTAFQRSLGAGIFGGDGFLLQKLEGPCTAWVELGGQIVVKDLAPGETLLVHPGHIGMFQDSVSFDVTLMRGIANALFGGDGLFVARLTGPGRVWLQSLTVPNLAHALSPYLGGEGSGVTAGAAGGLVGSIVRGILK
jgi:uncharacterized protein (AIM24 family)